MMANVWSDGHQSVGNRAGGDEASVWSDGHQSVGNRAGGDDKNLGECLGRIIKGVVSPCFPGCLPSRRPR